MFELMQSSKYGSDVGVRLGILWTLALEAGRNHENTSPPEISGRTSAAWPELAVSLKSVHLCIHFQYLTAMESLEGKESNWKRQRKRERARNFFLRNCKHPQCQNISLVRKNKSS